MQDTSKAPRRSVLLTDHKISSMNLWEDEDDEVEIINGQDE